MVCLSVTDLHNTGMEEGRRVKGKGWRRGKEEKEVWARKGKRGVGGEQRKGWRLGRVGEWLDGRGSGKRGEIWAVMYV